MSARVVLAFSFVLLAVSANATERDDRAEQRVSLGRQLFEENWLRPAADGSPLALTAAGDGLGPLFNGGSCVECHHIGGAGGAGGNEHNVELLSVVLPLGTPNKAKLDVLNRAKRTHPGFFDRTDITLHRFGLDPDGSLAKYEAFRWELRSRFPNGVRPAHETEQVFSDGLSFQLAQRNTPPLFGVGLIDKVPAHLVIKTAEEQKKHFPDLAGRPIDSGAGRFGWRGQISSLEDFVRTACAAELGLRVRATHGRTIHDQAKWPIPDDTKRLTSKLRPDMSEEQVEALVAFVASLPAPREVVPADIESAIDAEAGRQVFEAIGCAVCHVENVGPAKGIYSDLLLHDMGVLLADRVSAPLPPPRVVRTAGRVISQGGGGGGYSGGSGSIRSPGMLVTQPPSLGEITRATQEFRTPPLWGVADSAPYLHDGRAETLEEAIRMHGGQAELVRLEFETLSVEQQSQLLAFLGTLKAPQFD